MFVWVLIFGGVLIAFVLVFLAKLAYDDCRFCVQARKTNNGWLIYQSEAGRFAVVRRNFVAQNEQVFFSNLYNRLAIRWISDIHTSGTFATMAEAEAAVQWAVEEDARRMQAEEEKRKDRTWKPFSQPTPPRPRPKPPTRAAAVETVEEELERLRKEIEELVGTDEDNFGVPK